MAAVLVTHVLQYAGPGVVDVLLAHGYDLYCHDRSFATEAARLAFMAQRVGGQTPGAGQLRLLRGQTPAEIAAELPEPVYRVVLNDVHANQPLPYCEIPQAHFTAAFADLVLFPLALSQLLLPAMQAHGQGSIVFITSARALKPEPGFTVATSIRAAASAMALSLASEVAAQQIQVNVVQPNFLYSELYYPKATYLDDPAGRALIAAQVPMGRLGEPAELGALVEWLVSGRSGFVTAQTIGFTGGWPL